MAAEKPPQCTNCGYAEWQRTPKGNIRRNIAGQCDWTPFDEPMPKCVREVRIDKIAIWPGDGNGCPTWQPE